MIGLWPLSHPCDALVQVLAAPALRFGVARLI